MSDELAAAFDALEIALDGHTGPPPGQGELSQGFMRSLVDRMRAHPEMTHHGVIRRTPGGGVEIVTLSNPDN